MAARSRKHEDSISKMASAIFETDALASRERFEEKVSLFTHARRPKRGPLKRAKRQEPQSPIQALSPRVIYPCSRSLYQPPFLSSDPLPGVTTYIPPLANPLGYVTANKLDGTVQLLAILDPSLADFRSSLSGGFILAQYQVPPFLGPVTLDFTAHARVKFSYTLVPPDVGQPTEQPDWFICLTLVFTVRLLQGQAYLDQSYDDVWLSKNSGSPACDTFPAVSSGLPESPRELPPLRVMASPGDILVASLTANLNLAFPPLEVNKPFKLGVTASRDAVFRGIPFFAPGYVKVSDLQVQACGPGPDVRISPFAAEAG